MGKFAGKALKSLILDLLCSAAAEQGPQLGARLVVNGQLVVTQKWLHLAHITVAHYILYGIQSNTANKGNIGYNIRDVGPTGSPASVFETSNNQIM